MRVLQILYSGLGGHGSVVFSMINADKKHAWENILLFYGAEDLKEEYKLQCLEKNIHFYFVKKTKKIDIDAVKQILTIIRQENPHKILLHSTTLAPYLMFASRRVKSSIVMVEHTPNSHKAKFEWLASFLGMRLFPKLVYLTPEYQNETKRKLGPFFQAKKVHIISNGIDTEFFSPSFSKKPAEPGIIISMVGRFSVTKNQQTLLQVFLTLKKLRESLGLTLIMAGDGENLNSIKNEIQRQNAESYCFLPGILNEEQIRDLLRQTNIYVHSTLSETMSTAIMQAMACGLPVIASKIDGTKNMIIDGVNGLFFPQYDENALLSQLQKLLDNNDEANRLAANARDYAVKKFSHEKMFANYHQLLTA